MKRAALVAALGVFQNQWFDYADASGSFFSG